jgi:hypothetical protein
MTATLDVLSIADRARLRVIRKNCTVCGAALGFGHAARRWCDGCAPPVLEMWRAPGDHARYLEELRRSGGRWT